jgi:hypothetical protein
MSRQPFSSILRNAEELLGDDDEDEIEEDEDDGAFTDNEDYSLYDWVNYAEVGWDEAMQTYFLQAIELDDGPVWWFGKLPRELPTFEDLCKAIDGAFGGRVRFDFVDTIERK